MWRLIGQPLCLEFGAYTDYLGMGPGYFQTEPAVLVGASGNDLTTARAKRAMLILQPITGWHSSYGVAQHGIHVCIDLVRRIRR
jgi:hypothetical protein